MKVLFDEIIGLSKLSHCRSIRLCEAVLECCNELGEVLGQAAAKFRHWSRAIRPLQSWAIVRPRKPSPPCAQNSASIGGSARNISTSSAMLACALRQRSQGAQRASAAHPDATTRVLPRMHWASRTEKAHGSAATNETGPTYRRAVTRRASWIFAPEPARRKQEGASSGQTCVEQFDTTARSSSRSPLANAPTSSACTLGAKPGEAITRAPRRMKIASDSNDLTI